MCSIAPALGFDAAAAVSLHRRRGVAAPAACGVMARKPVLRVGAAVSSSAPTKKRSRDGFDGEIGLSEGLAGGKVSAIPAPGKGQKWLEERMRAELDAIRVLHRKAVLLCRGAARSGAAAPVAKGDAKFSAAGLRRKEPLEAEAKRKKTSPSKCAPEAKKQSMEALKQQQQHRRPILCATPPTTTTKRSVVKAVDKAREVEKTRRLEEIAVAREKCRQEVLEIERTRLPDETVYPRDLEELGIDFQYAVTRTWKQAHGPAI
ncbi:hypothetical protein HU200_008203 [Digitaria exilis]|uniref:Uncharacterized protein n=1 Tax=Digitaria exilis TaxID=1010633 RepID=A0A835FLT5_9POAL|nr:hypothetical protein HU200_008203 [Digitaria exilis]CAB3465316.1 unnamed protein product [Digitaria exilis]